MEVTAPKQRSGRADMKFPQSPGAGSSNALPLRCLSAPKITTDIWPHPLTAEGRETHPAVVPSGATLADLIADVFPGACTLGASALPLRCLSADATIAAAIDGRAVPRAAWHETRLGDGQIVTLRTTAGDGGDKNPLLFLDLAG